MNYGQAQLEDILDHLDEGVYIVDHGRRITFWNRGAERITGWTRGETVGRNCDDGLMQHIDDAGEPACADVCPLRAAMEKREIFECQLYIQHKNGHRLPVRLRTSPLLDEKGGLVGAVEIFHDNTMRMIDLETINELKNAALLDPLTGIGNRRFGELQLHSRLDEAQRYGFPFGFLFMDIDKFKLVNDTFGHDVGDEVLKMITHTLAANLRSHDLIARWGGEEFIALIAHIIRADQLAFIARKLITLMNRSTISSGDQLIRVTCSIGATMIQAQDTADSIIKRADRLMYQAKLQGGNRVVAD
jgi:diguanylate cyclase (GGDEF)-like protein/PAS domain S-box-containing protein